MYIKVRPRRIDNVVYPPIVSAFLNVLALAAACALFLPFSAPLLDHHFSERLPGHFHIYPAEVLVKHAHPHEIPHFHGVEAGTPRGSETASGSEGKIIFLPPQEDGTAASQSISITPALLTSASWLLIPPMLAVVIACAELHMRNFVPRLEAPPPRLPS